MCSKIDWNISLLKYPPEISSLRIFGSKGRTCGTARLALPFIFPQISKGLYLDTDVIFLKSVSSLWNQFDKFTDQSVFGLTACLHLYGTNKTKVPFPGSTGVNAGVMLLDFSKARQISPYFLQQLGSLAALYEEDIVYGDQDLLNIYLHHNNEQLHMVNCNWNYRKGACQYEETNR